MVWPVCWQHRTAGPCGPRKMHTTPHRMSHTAAHPRTGAGAVPSGVFLLLLVVSLTPPASSRHVHSVDEFREAGPAARGVQGWPRTLAIILAETRSSDLTWSNFQQNVLGPLNADLAVCASTRSNPDDPFMRAAKYKWIYPEPVDWSEAYDRACRCRGCWRSILQLDGQLFGGILDANHQHKGSAGILIFFRWFLLQKLIKSRVVEAYDYFMVTRSDYYYIAPHPRIGDETDPSLIWIPEGEDYSGITDRHILVPRMHLYAALSLMDPIIEDPEALYNAMRYKSGWNLEQYIHFHFELHGLLKFVRRFPRVMFAVRGENASTRWAVGSYKEDLGMIVKYDTEYELAKKSTPLQELM